MLTSEQARKNQEIYGFNELVEGKKKHHPDIPGAIQRFSCHYSDYCSNRIRLSGRCRERGRYIYRHYY